MSKKSSRNNSGWLRQQAEQQRKAQAAKLARRTEQQTNEAQAKEFLSKLMTEYVEQKARLARLAPAFADRCWRVHELMGQARRDWERAEAAEAKVRELQAQLDARPKTNGHTPAKKPAVKRVT